MADSFHPASRLHALNRNVQRTVSDFHFHKTQDEARRSQLTDLNGGAHFQPQTPFRGNLSFCKEKLRVDKFLCLKFQRDFKAPESVFHLQRGTCTPLTRAPPSALQGWRRGRRVTAPGQPTPLTCPRGRRGGRPWAPAARQPGCQAGDALGGAPPWAGPAATPAPVPPASGPRGAENHAAQSQPRGGACR